MWNRWPKVTSVVVFGCAFLCCFCPSHEESERCTSCCWMVTLLNVDVMEKIGVSVSVIHEYSEAIS